MMHLLKKETRLNEIIKSVNDLKIILHLILVNFVATMWTIPLTMIGRPHWCCFCFLYQRSTFIRLLTTWIIWVFFFLKKQTNTVHRWYSNSNEEEKKTTLKATKEWNENETETVKMKQITLIWSSIHVQIPKVALWSICTVHSFSMTHLNIGGFIMWRIRLTTVWLAYRFTTKPFQPIERIVSRKILFQTFFLICYLSFECIFF